MNFAPGSLVRARGREWVVQPQSAPPVFHLKPLGGSDAEATAIHAGLELVAPAAFSPPNPARPGDANSARLLRDAVRLGFRSSVGPFRCLSGIAVEPRPYQLVPLLMALRQDPVRLMIADDVGIGKTIEAALIAKELMARGEADNLCILCPPHLAEQWQAELAGKFGIDAALILPATVRKLEAECPREVSVFEYFPVTIVSTDYIKQERRREDFLRAAPQLIIVDEAHTCTQAGQSAQQRFRLLQRLSADTRRGLILVTATPHSGNDQSFKSMLSLLLPEFADLPDNLAGEQNRASREKLAMHFVQRRRQDISTHFVEDTPFPEREESDAPYRLHPQYMDLLSKALSYAREVISNDTGTKFQQRIRWWSALAMLRSISSSPAAAAATLRARARTADAETDEEVEMLGRRSVLDLTEEETAESIDLNPGADAETGNTPTRKRLQDLAKLAEGLKGAKDAKLQNITSVLKTLLKDNRSPIVFCKYIATAEYFTDELRKYLPKGVEIACVTGLLPHDERERRIFELSEKPQRVLICTDCLSEGINLQESFDSVVHADLAWSPTRHEQREGRVDRFNQASDLVKIVTVFGHDNPVDGLVLDILIRKHQRIRNALGISVPVPVETEKVLEAMIASLLLKGTDSLQGSLFSAEDLEETKAFDLEWQKAADREKRSRTIFAQNAIKVEEVQKELEEIRRANGSPLDVERFVKDAVVCCGGTAAPGAPALLDFSNTPDLLQNRSGVHGTLSAVFAQPVRRGSVMLSRTSRVVTALSEYVMDCTLADAEDAPAARCGVVSTEAVSVMTTLLLLRMRFQLSGTKKEMLAEDAVIAAFRGSPASPQWLRLEEAEPLLAVPPRVSIPKEMATAVLTQVISNLPDLRTYFLQLGEQRGKEALAAHRRVRTALAGTQAARDIRLQGEPDVLGVYVLMPAGGHK